MAILLIVMGKNEDWNKLSEQTIRFLAAVYLFSHVASKNVFGTRKQQRLVETKF